MKSSTDPRHQKRRDIVKQLFPQSFAKQGNQSLLTKNILSQKETLDQIIAKAAPAWPMEKLNKIDLAILRLAVYELEQKQNPPKSDH